MIIFRRFVLFLFLSNCTYVFAGTGFGALNQQIKTTLLSSGNFRPGNPGTDTIVIRFDYKQSALFHSYTLETLDSIVNILLRDTAIKLSIDGYAHKDEGSDTICYYLSLNRALLIQTYILGRGIDSSRIIALNAYGNSRQKYVTKDKTGLLVNCRAELRVIYPPPSPKIQKALDSDEDGIADSEDKCPDVFGYKDNSGCPDKDAVIVPFEVHESDLQRMTYHVLDSVIEVLKDNPALSISIAGHAHIAEGAYSVCEKLATERADIVKLYLLSRQIMATRILSVKSYGITRPINAGKNPLEIIKNARAEIMFTNK